MKGGGLSGLMQMAEHGYMTQQVDSLVMSAADLVGMRVVSNLTLEVNGEKVHYDYVLLDRHGLLILSSIGQAGRVLRGTSTDNYWKTKADGERSGRLDNPLAQNKRAIAQLKTALVITGRRIPDEYFTDLVVAAGADISGLRLPGPDQLKVIDARELAASLKARYDFAPNQGLIEQHEIDDLISLFQALDRTDSRGDHAVEESVSTASPLGRLRRHKAANVAVADHVAGLAPAAPRLTGERYPSYATVKRRGVPVALLMLVLALALGVWLFRFGGYGMVVNSLVALLPAPSQAELPSPGESGTTVSVDQAEASLQRMQPQIFARVTNRGTPQVVTAGGVSKFTWTYTVASNSAPHKYTLGFDINGDIVYVDSE